MALPVLADHFFEDLRPDSAFISKWKDEGPWGPHLMPIYFWDGTLFVATSEENPSISKPNWCLVRADATKLAQLHSEADLFSDVGADIELVSTNGAIDLSALTVTGIQPPPPAPADLPKAPTAKPAMKPNAPPPPPPDSEFGEKTPPPLSRTVKPAASAPKAPPAPAASAKSLGAMNDLNAIWGQLNASVGPAMILLVHGNDCFPWKWDPQLEGGSVQPISLEMPSPFRIAQRTHKSYHGPIATNAPTTSFFENWNRGQIPENLTIAPILHRDQLTGLLLTWGTKEKNTKETLLTLETTAKAVGRIFEEQPEILRAA